MVTPTDPYAPVPIIAPVEVRKVVRRIVGYHVICRACGRTFAARASWAQHCSVRCRQRACRLRKLHREREEQAAEERRVAAAEERLRVLRRGCKAREAL